MPVSTDHSQWSPHKPRVTKEDALASIAFLTLAAKGRSCDPTLHDIATAVVQAAPLLDLSDDPEGVNIETEAIRRVCERHAWLDDRRVVIMPRRKSR